MEMKKLTHSFLLAILFSVLIFNTVYAQGYSFSVQKEIVKVFWNKDGTMSLEYTWDFINQPGAHVIDFVDVGMPNPSFDITTVKADVNGESVSVSTSDYQGSGSGFAIVMGAQAIPANGKGNVHVFVGKISNVLYGDSKDPKYVSAVFAPTYFGSQYIVDHTDYTVIFHLPSGIKPEEPRWHSAPSGFPSEPQIALNTDGQITYIWQSATAIAYTQYIFGASFPKSYIPADSIVVATPVPIRVPTPIVLKQTSSRSGIPPVFLFFGVFFGMLIIGSIFLFRAPYKLEYLPPKVSIEGHGIKRGLTAVEAAILLEQPLDKVMTMILFGVIKKGAAQVIKREPLEIQVTDPLPGGLHQYEIDFLKAFSGEKTETLEWIKRDKRKNVLEEMSVNLVRSVSEKMRGFSRKDTIDYCQDIVRRAWQQVEEANTPDVKSQKFDENLEWTMLDRHYDRRSREILTELVYLPIWWSHYDPDWHSTSVEKGSSSFLQGNTSLPTPSQGEGGGNMPPSLLGADVAASIANGVQVFSQKVIGNVNDFTNRITHITNPPPPEPSWSRSSDKSSRRESNWDSGGGSNWDSGGGNSCACACACAGCACACAGDGR